jgi:hypothetical protein
LIGFRLRAGALQSDFIINAGHAKNMVTAAHPLRKSERKQQATQIVKLDIRVGRAAQNLKKQFIVFARQG